MKEIILFIMTYILVFLTYQLFIMRKAKKKNSNKKPIEINYLVYKYKLDLKKIKYKKLLLTISIVSSLDISILVTLVLIIDNYLLQILIALLLVIPLIIISYSFIGRYYVKRGMTKDE